MPQLATLTNVFEPSGSNDSLWANATELVVSTVATPQALQSAEYIQKTYGNRSWGATDKITLRAWQTRRNLSVLAEWEAKDPTEEFSGPDSFLDRIALLFPSDEMTPLGLMGSKESPATIWTWRSDDKLERLTAKGPGSIVAESNVGLRADASWSKGNWRVQISGPNDFANKPKKFSVAVWSGSSAERAGLKAFYPGWVTVNKMT